MILHLGFSLCHCLNPIPIDGIEESFIGIKRRRFRFALSIIQCSKNNKSFFVYMVKWPLYTDKVSKLDFF